MPATVWAPPAHAVGPGWARWVRTACRRSFLPPASVWRELACADILAPAEVDAHAGVWRSVPFWAALIDPAAAHPVPPPPEQDGPTSTTVPAAQDTPGWAAGDGAVEAGGQVGSGGESVPAADVVFADLTDTDTTEVDGRFGMIAARLLRGGGILAVLTRCRHHPDHAGPMTDLSGAVVASAQNADLLYLQHIVIPAMPLRAPHRSNPMPDLEASARSGAAAAAEGRRPADHVVAHADLLVFGRPHTDRRPLAPDGSRPSAVAAAVEPVGVRR